MRLLFYSKYSQVSANLIETLRHAPVDVGKVIDQSISLDNREVRKIVMKDQKIQIRNVPCILVILPSGVVEKYEGLNCLNWINEMVAKVLAESQPAPEPPPAPVPPPEPSVEESPPPPPPPPAEAQGSKAKPSATQISQLEDVEDAPDPRPRKPKVGIRDGPSSYHLTDQFEVSSDSEEEDRREAILRKRHTKDKSQTAVGGKGSELMSMAMAIQKEREKESAVGGPQGPRMQTDIRPV